MNQKLSLNFFLTFIVLLVNTGVGIYMLLNGFIISDFLSEWIYPTWVISLCGIFLILGSIFFLPKSSYKYAGMISIFVFFSAGFTLIRYEHLTYAIVPLTWMFAILWIMILRKRELNVAA